MVICDKEDTETIKNTKRTIKVPHSVDTSLSKFRELVMDREA